MLVLGHGAGSSMTSPFLTGFCEQIAGLGVATHRFDFPYMRAGRRAPDRAPVLIEAYREAWSRAVELAAGLPVLAGGRSMGGRIASMAAAEGMPAAGLVFLAYPLHPPGRPERIRDAHLYGLQMPMLFLQGTRDSLRAAGVAGGRAGAPGLACPARLDRGRRPLVRPGRGQPRRAPRSGLRWRRSRPPSWSAWWPARR